MNRKLQNKFGLTLTEMVVVIAIISMLVAFGLPVIRVFHESFESKAGGKSMISAALSAARAIAAKEQHYAGVRFQRDLSGNQYMIFIIHDFEKTGLNPGFRAVENLKPTKLPENLGVMDLMVRTNHGTNWTDAEEVAAESLTAVHLDDTNLQNLGPDQNNRYITDTSTFSIVFSPAGKLVMRTVRVRNRDGIYQPNNSITNKVSRDSIFNSPENITTHQTGKFIQDDYAELGLGAETSRNNFVIYDKARFEKLSANQKFEYLSRLEPVFINSYTGTIISTD
ncbi:MAG: prepilin-type N-terminal cleavage/methylation domain-containing protein [Sedimentisphaerales bacterium]|nr:prepilin-type N-terminal cleavage/methylation domain-containing protein [Sedimentisphaerales bacterium]